MVYAVLSYDTSLRLVQNRYAQRNKNRYVIMLRFVLPRFYSPEGSYHVMVSIVYRSGRLSERWHMLVICHTLLNVLIT